MLNKIDTLQLTIDNQNKTINDLKSILTSVKDKLSTQIRINFGGSEKHKSQKCKKDDDSQKESGNDEEGNNDDSECNTINETLEEKDNNEYKRPCKRDYKSVKADEIIELGFNDSELEGAVYLETLESYRFYYIPGKIVKVLIKRPKYIKDNKSMVKPLPWAPDVFDRRHISASLAAAILTFKYYYHIPVERKLKMFNNGNVKIAKSTLHDYTKVAIDALEGVFQAIREKVLASDRLHIDETIMPIVDKLLHHTRKGYDWGFTSPKQNLVYFVTNNGSRSEMVLDSELKYFEGNYIHTDGYGAYKKVGERLNKDIKQIPCLVHIRRYFIWALDYHKKYATEALGYIDRIFRYDKMLKAKFKKGNEIIKHRKVYLTYLLDKFKMWLKKKVSAPNFEETDNIGKAINYAYSRIDNFYIVCKNSNLVLENNLAERNMRSHALGRNNFRFVVNEESAVRTCKIYSIMESCRMNHIDPYQYLYAVLSREPKLGETWYDLLPNKIKL